MEQTQKQTQDETTLGALLREKLRQWDRDTPESQAGADTKGHYFKPTNNVSRETFNTVRDNPGRTRVEITMMLGARGFNKASVSSLLGQMVKQKMLRDIEGHVYAVAKEYTPIKSHSTLKNKAKPVKPKADARGEKGEAGIAALPAAATAPIVKTEWDAKTMIDHLSVRQARALYEELKKLFEGQ